MTSATNLVALIVLSCILAIQFINASETIEIVSSFNYPEVYRDSNVIDDYHGTKIADPYRWLEDPDSNETIAFVEAQNAITRPYLDSCTYKSEIKQRLTQLWDYPTYSSPFKKGNKYFFFMNTGLQNQDVLYIQDSLDSEAKIFFDPNTLSEDGTVALSEHKFSEDGKIFAYGLSASGSDWITIHFKSVETGQDYPEVLKNVKFTSISWTKDNKGIFYGKFPEQDKNDGSETTAIKDQKLYYHRVNTPQSEDVLVVEFPDKPFWRITGHVSDCGEYLIINVVESTSDNMLFIARLSKTPEIREKLEITQIVFNFGTSTRYITNKGSKFVFRTNRNAPNYKIITIDLDHPQEENWTTLLPEHAQNVMSHAVCVNNNSLIVHYIQDVQSVLQLYNLENGEFVKTFPLMKASKISGYSGNKDQSEIFYSVTSFLNPGIIYHYDLNQPNSEPKVFREISVPDFDPKQYEAKQIFYESKDGTKVPMFIVSKKNVKLNGNNPVLLYGYGGFNVNLLPGFSVSRLVFIQNMNGVLAIPNIRGGGEYGERWHRAGMRLNKQNVFDDFQYAAKYLINMNYTKPELLTIQGGSNGGLLVAACINQAPELYGAAIAQVGVLDMLRYHKFTVGHAWVTEYGSSDNKTDFDNLLKYSPVHNIMSLSSPQGRVYPATLVTTADHDDRVVPLHSLKYIAQLQYNAKHSPRQKKPLLARIDTKAGHGGGKPTAKIIEEFTDILSFISLSLNIPFNK